MAKICTDKEQSKWLIKHGLDPKTADMAWFPNKNKPTVLDCKLDDRLISMGNFIPAWSFTTLMAFMPRRINVGRFSIVRSGHEMNEIRYGTGWNMVSYAAPEPVDAAVPMIAFLLLKHHI
jgi:hypothetical protein